MGVLGPAGLLSFIVATAVPEAVILFGLGVLMATAIAISIEIIVNTCSSFIITSMVISVVVIIITIMIRLVLLL